MLDIFKFRKRYLASFLKSTLKNIQWHHFFTLLMVKNFDNDNKVWKIISKYL